MDHFKPENMSVIDKLKKFFAPLDFEFVAPLSLETAVERLKSQDTSGQWLVPERINVTVEHRDLDAHRFRVLTKRARHVSTEAKGVLQRQGENQTLVKGRVRNDSALWIITSLSIGLAWWVFRSNASSVPFFVGFLWIIVLPYVLYSAATHRARMLHLIKQALFNTQE
jgi:hypothetical protein